MTVRLRPSRSASWLGRAGRGTARSGGQIAAVAVARKIAVLAWHLLTRGEDYAFARSSLVRKKADAVAQRAGAALERPPMVTPARDR